MAIAGQYFARVVTGVFDSFFAARGATRAASGQPDAVQYCAARWFAEVIYLPSDGPNYCPRVEVGVLPVLFDDRRRNRVDVMHTVSDGCDLRRYNLLWRYTSEPAAIDVFTRVRDEIFAVYADEYVNDLARLRDLLIQRHELLETQWSREIAEHNEGVSRDKAEQAFQDGDYATALQHFMAIPVEMRSASDLRKLFIASKRTSSH